MFEKARSIDSNGYGKRSQHTNRPATGESQGR